MKQKLMTQEQLQKLKDKGLSFKQLRAVCEIVCDHELIGDCDLEIVDEAGETDRKASKNRETEGPGREAGGDLMNKLSEQPIPDEWVNRLQEIRPDSPDWLVMEGLDAFRLGARYVEEQLITSSTDIAEIRRLEKQIYNLNIFLDDANKRLAAEKALDQVERDERLEKFQLLFETLEKEGARIDELERANKEHYTQGNEANDGIRGLDGRLKEVEQIQTDGHDNWMECREKIKTLETGKVDGAIFRCGVLLEKIKALEKSDKEHYTQAGAEPKMEDVLPGVKTQPDGWVGHPPNCTGCEVCQEQPTPPPAIETAFERLDNQFKRIKTIVRDIEELKNTQTGQCISFVSVEERLETLEAFAEAHDKPRPDPMFGIGPLIDPAQIRRKDERIKRHCDVLRGVADEIESA